MSATRILPPEEWSRLGEDKAAFYATVKPEDVRVVVVEDSGEIVASLAVMRMTHWECFWMAPEKVGNAGVTRALLKGALAEAKEYAPNWFIANSDSEEMNETLARLGGEWMPIHTFMLQVRGVEV